jgi:hypothetical protein
MNDTTEEIKTRLAMLLKKETRTKEEKAEIHVLNTELAERKKAAKSISNIELETATLAEFPSPTTPLTSLPIPTTPQQIEDFGFTEEDEDLIERF